MSAYDEMLSDLAELQHHKEQDRRTEIINQEIDKAIASGADGLHVARLEAIRNRASGTKLWAGNTP